MSREPEFLAKHREALRHAFEACEALKMNAVERAPRGEHYRRLTAANKQLEGTCRQMFHWRGDDPAWIKLGTVYARAAKVATRLLLLEKWSEFHGLGQLYALGERRIAALAERPTGRSQEKLILPGDISPWFDGSKVTKPHLLH